MKRYKNKLRFFRNSTGFSMIGVLVASTVGAIAILGLSQLSNVVALRALRAQQMFNFILLSEEIKQTFMSGKPPGCAPPDICWNSCSSSLINYSDSTPLAFVIRAPSINGVLSDLYWGGQPSIETKGIKIQEIKFTPGPLVTPTPLPSTEASVSIHFSLSEDTRETLTTPPSLNLHILLDSVVGGQIKECSLAGASLAGSGPPGIPHGCRKVELEQSFIGCGDTTDNKDLKGTAFGYKSGYQNHIDGIGNTFFGSKAGMENTKGEENTFLGYKAGEKTFHNTVTNVPGSFNTFLGYEAGSDNTEGLHNTMIGYKAKSGATVRDKLNIGNLIEGTVLWTPRDATKYTPPTPDFPEIILRGQVEVKPPTSSAAWITASTDLSLSVIGEVWMRKKNILPTPPTPTPEFKVSVEGSGTNPEITVTTDKFKIQQVSPPDTGKFVELTIEGTTTPKITTNADLEVNPSSSSGYGLSARGGLKLQDRDTSVSDPLITTADSSKQWIIKGNLEVTGEGTGKTSEFSKSLDIEKNLTVGEKGTFVKLLGKKDRIFNEDLTIRTKAILDIADLTTGSYTIERAHLPGNWQIDNLNHNSHVHPHDHPPYPGGPYARPGHARDPPLPASIPRCSPCGSSRTLKRNIKPFKDYEKSLENILNTPLFTYQYKKDKGDHPEKVRMGVISEELPKDLQILDKDKPSTPDWLSIYGTLWAGIKALSKRLQDIMEKSKANVTELAQSLKKHFSDTISYFKEETISQITNTKNQLTKLKEKAQKEKKQAKQNNQEFTELKKQFQKTKLILKNSDKELKSLLKELETARKKLKKLLSREKKKTVSKLEKKQGRGEGLLKGI